MKYHGHIYYDEKSESSVLKLSEDLQKINLPTLKILPLMGRASGPHPLPMFEIHFEQEDYPFVKTWLFHRRGIHNVLLHESTEQDQKDHTHGAHWLGKQVQIDFGYFKT